MVLKSVPRIHKGEEKVLVLVFWLGGWFFFLVGWFFKTTTKKPWTHCHSFISQSLPCLLGSSVQTCCVKMTVL